MDSSTENVAYDEKKKEEERTETTRKVGVPSNIPCN